MFNIGPLELIAILIVALLVVGPRRLPEMSRTIGRGLREFRRTSEEVKRSLEFDLDEDEPPPARGRSTSPRPKGGAAESASGAGSEPEGTSPPEGSPPGVTSE
jgi:Tat protein translocase TatB subunit